MIVTLRFIPDRYSVGYFLKTLSSISSKHIVKFKPQLKRNVSEKQKDSNFMGNSVLTV